MSTQVPKGAPHAADIPARSTTTTIDTSLLDAVLEATRPSTLERRSERGDILEQFLAEPDDVMALSMWLSGVWPEGPDRKRALCQRLTRDIAHLDALLSEQVNAILHHPRFQQLEATWRGLQYLVWQVPDGENIKIRVLNVSWAELVRDLERALEFDQSQLFRKVYSEEFGMPGGQPFGVLLGDYQIHLRPSREHPSDDVAALGSISAVAAAAFAPFIAGANPSLLDLDSFIELERPINLTATLDSLEHLKWLALRDSEDARFVGLALPRVLMRLPYEDVGGQTHGFRFREEVGRADRCDYLWGNAVYAFGAVLMRAFARSGWLASIRGQEEAGGGGTVFDLTAHSFATDRRGLIPKSSTEVLITESLDRQLGEMGFLPLCWHADTNLSTFYGSQSIQRPKTYDELPATVNARLSAMLQYVFCTSRFAHYLQVMLRNKSGSFFGTAECEDFLRRWLVKYTNASESASQEMKARFPLREHRVEVRELPGRPGQYSCIVHLRPQFQLDQMTASIRLVALGADSR